MYFSKKFEISFNFLKEIKASKFKKSEVLRGAGRAPAPLNNPPGGRKSAIKYKTSWQLQAFRPNQVSIKCRKIPKIQKIFSLTIWFKNANYAIKICPPHPRSLKTRFLQWKIFRKKILPPPRKIF